MAHERFQAGHQPEDLRVEDRTGPTAVAAPSSASVAPPHGSTLDGNAAAAAAATASADTDTLTALLSSDSAQMKPSDQEVVAGAEGACVSSGEVWPGPPVQSLAAAEAEAKNSSGSTSFADAGRGSLSDNDAGSRGLDDAALVGGQGSKVAEGGAAVAAVAAATAAGTGVDIWQGGGPRGGEEDKEEGVGSWAVSGVHDDRGTRHIVAGSGEVGVSSDEMLFGGKNDGGLTPATPTAPAAAGLVPAGSVVGTRAEEGEKEDDEEEGEEVRIRRKKRAIEEAVEG